LSNNFAVTHPSEPNYMAAVGGEYFGLDGDPFTAVPQNVSSVVDLLEEKGISWGLYQEDMPYTGYQGFSWVNTKTGANDYVRKHK
jgi:acid phosphatase